MLSIGLERRQDNIGGTSEISDFRQYLTFVRVLYCHGSLVHGSRGAFRSLNSRPSARLSVLLTARPRAPRFAALFRVEGSGCAGGFVVVTASAMHYILG